MRISSNKKREETEKEKIKEDAINILRVVRIGLSPSQSSYTEQNQEEEDNRSLLSIIERIIRDELLRRDLGTQQDKQDHEVERNIADKKHDDNIAKWEAEARERILLRNLEAASQAQNRRKKEAVIRG